MGKNEVDSEPLLSVKQIQEIVLELSRLTEEIQCYLLTKLLPQAVSHAKTQESAGSKNQAPRVANTIRLKLDYVPEKIADAAKTAEISDIDLAALKRMRPRIRKLILTLLPDDQQSSPSKQGGEDE